ncbi:MAG: DUF1294 domain-containing protein [Bacilli bacterium]
MTTKQIILIAFSAYLLLMSLITIILFFKDKKMAQKNNSEVRIKESTLLGFTAFGGALGALIGSLLAHHKTNKLYFTLTIAVSLILEIATLVIMLVL